MPHRGHEKGIKAKEGEQFEPVTLSARVRQWLQRRIQDELLGRQWADYSLRPAVRECALHIFNKGGGKREIVNEIWCDTLYDFTLVESIQMTHPEPIPSNVKRGHKFVMVKIKISGVECPMVLPYLLHVHETIGHNNLRNWRFINVNDMAAKHEIRNMNKATLPSLESLRGSQSSNGLAELKVPNAIMFGGRLLTILDPMEEEQKIKECQSVQSHNSHSAPKLPSTPFMAPRDQLESELKRKRKGRKAVRKSKSKKKQGGMQLPAIR
jgi:hypothetical protein